MISAAMLGMSRAEQSRPSGREGHSDEDRRDLFVFINVCQVAPS